MAHTSLKIEEFTRHVKHQNPEKIKDLLDSGEVHIDSLLCGVEKPLIFACRRGYLFSIETLLEYGADIYEKDRYGNTALMRASECGHLEVVKFLCENGADICSYISEKNTFNYTALMLASMRGHLEIVRFLCENGATESINEKNNGGWTALMLASTYGHLDIVNFLCENGATQTPH